MGSRQNKTPESYVYGILAKKDFTEGEIAYRLKRRFDLSESEVSAILDKLKRFNFINDERFVKLFTLTKLRQGYGPYYICRKLSEKMVDISVEDVEEIAFKENLEIEQIAVDVCRNKVRNITNKSGKISENTPSAISVYKKCFDFLVRRGFDIELSRRIAKEESKYEGDFS
ncbi:hypothetical protein Flexsi_2144 [Flexistipes sinusarabici DSM 4947]|uniref:Regulatory protein RecX n=1 Tax=Flexistipes sinusarabici (strain ATCC 49648 / DSM 4947 / MAS 10) TaxID=717231 RepID=F8E5K3_FLESM|nr:regulatory protein RecX [Flexistipes sinusarabici]AEI15766.1 hypothetical protein Flexsi_2144 [Flexistipes sinusarabici DSM 4947]